MDKTAYNETIQKLYKASSRMTTAMYKEPQWRAARSSIVMQSFAHGSIAGLLVVFLTRQRGPVRSSYLLPVVCGIGWGSAINVILTNSMVSRYVISGSPSANELRKVTLSRTILEAMRNVSSSAGVDQDVMDQFGVTQDTFLRVLDRDDEVYGGDEDEDLVFEREEVNVEDSRKEYESNLANSKKNRLPLSERLEIAKRERMASLAANKVLIKVPKVVIKEEVEGVEGVEGEEVNTESIEKPTTNQVTDYQFERIDKPVAPRLSLKQRLEARMKRIEEQRIEREASIGTIDSSEKSENKSDVMPFQDEDTTWDNEEED